MMNAQTEIQNPEATDAPQDVVAAVGANPVSVLLDDKLYGAFYQKVKFEVDQFEPDLTSETGRKAIASLAYKVTRTKTAIDKAGKELNAEARKKIDAVDARRREIWDEFEELAKRARKPLDEWEAEEAARVEQCMAVLEAIEACANGLIGGSPQPYAVLLHELDGFVIDEALGEFEEQARLALDAARERLTAAWAEEQRQAALQAELEQLRAEKAERERKDAEKAEAERLGALAKEKAEREAAEAAERERLAKEKAEREAAEQKEREERIAQEAREAAERDAQEKIDEANRRAQEAIEAANEERRRNQESASAATYDRAHRAKVMAEAMTGFGNLGLGGEACRVILTAIHDGEIPHVTINF